MDVLSDVLRAVRLTGAIYFDVDAGVSLGRRVAQYRRDCRRRHAGG